MPVVVSDGKPFAWNLHYVNLATCPAMTSSQPISSIYKWLQPPLMYAFSDRELAMRQVADHSNTFVQVKGNIVEMILNACTSSDRVFGLGFNTPDGIHTIVFVNAIRFDLASHGLLLDVCVLPMQKGMKEVKDFLLEISLLGNVCSIATNDEERVAWKKMLPAFVERCRTWTHRPDCLYLERTARHRALRQPHMRVRARQRHPGQRCLARLSTSGAHGDASSHRIGVPRALFRVNRRQGQRIDEDDGATGQGGPLLGVLEGRRAADGLLEVQEDEVLLEGVPGEGLEGT